MVGGDKSTRGRHVKGEIKKIEKRENKEKANSTKRKSKAYQIKNIRLETKSIRRGKSTERIKKIEYRKGTSTQGELQNLEQFF